MQANWSNYLAVEITIKRLTVAISQHSIHISLLNFKKDCCLEYLIFRVLLHIFHGGRAQIPRCFFFQGVLSKGNWTGLSFFLFSMGLTKKSLSDKLLLRPKHSFSSACQIFFTCILSTYRPGAGSK